MSRMQTRLIAVAYIRLVRESRFNHIASQTVDEAVEWLLDKIPLKSYLLLSAKTFSTTSMKYQVARPYPNY